MKSIETHDRRQDPNWVRGRKPTTYPTSDSSGSTDPKKGVHPKKQTKTKEKVYIPKKQTKTKEEQQRQEHKRKTNKLNNLKKCTTVFIRFCLLSSSGYQRTLGPGLQCTVVKTVWHNQFYSVFQSGLTSPLKLTSVRSYVPTLLERRCKTLDN